MIIGLKVEWFSFLFRTSFFKIFFKRSAHPSAPNLIKKDRAKRETGTPQMPSPFEANICYKCTNEISNRFALCVYSLSGSNMVARLLRFFSLIYVATQWERSRFP